MPHSPAHRIHPAWPVAAVTFTALLAAAAFRSTTGVFIGPIMETTGWPMTVVSGAASLNLVIYGLTAPFAAAIMQSWGVRRSITLSLTVVALASAATGFVTSPWQLWLLWGAFIGVGTGSLALTFGTIVANRWFVTHRNLVTGFFSAATAAGQVLFVPLIAHVAAMWGWQRATLVTALAAGLTALACAAWLRDRPSDVGATPYGEQAAAATPAPATASTPAGEEGASLAESPLRSAVRVLLTGARTWRYWALMGTFFVCGWSTNGVVVTHFVQAAHDHSMPATLAASLVGVIGVFDIIGTVASGWLTDHIDPRWLLAFYYVTRGISLVFLHGLMGPGVDLPMWGWIVFYGLDWTATVPPTVALCRELFGLADSGVAFGWVFAAHMVGAGFGAQTAGLLRAETGTYAAAWILSAALCVAAGVTALTIRRAPITPATPPVSRKSV